MNGQQYHMLPRYQVNLEGPQLACLEVSPLSTTTTEVWQLNTPPCRELSAILACPGVVSFNPLPACWNTQISQSHAVMGTRFTISIGQKPVSHTDLASSIFPCLPLLCGPGQQYKAHVPIRELYASCLLVLLSAHYQSACLVSCIALRGETHLLQQSDQKTIQTAYSYNLPNCSSLFFPMG